MRKFCRDVDFFSDMVFGKDFSECLFISGIYIGGVIVIYARPVSLHDLPLRFCEVDTTCGLCKTHTAVPQNGNVIPILVFSILHSILLNSYNQTYVLPRLSPDSILRLAEGKCKEILKKSKQILVKPEKAMFFLR